MSIAIPFRLSTSAALCASLALAACATVPSAAPLVEGQRADVMGTVVSVDTKPWSYDGNATVVLESAVHGRVAVHLPARWNLCKAPAVDVASLRVGSRALARGTVDGEGGVVVCMDPGDRLTRIQ